MEVLIDRGDYALIVRPSQSQGNGEVTVRRSPNGLQFDGTWEAMQGYDGIVDLLGKRPTAYRPYREVLELLGGRVPEGKPVEDGMPIGIIGIRNLAERHFSLKESDRRPLPRVRAAGKSAFVACTADVRIAMPIIMGFPRSRHDRLFVAPAWALREAGLDVVHAPTGGNKPPYRHPLHVRVIPAGERYDNNGDIPLSLRENAAIVFGQYLMPLAVGPVDRVGR